MGCEARIFFPQRFKKVFHRYRYCAPLHQGCLLFDGLHGHEPHAWPRDRLADRRRIGRIVLLPPDVGFDIAWWHQLHGMTEFHQLTRPKVRCRTGLHTDEARLQLPEKLEHLCAPQLPRDDNLAILIDAMHLEHALGEINADGANPHVDDPIR